MSLSILIVGATSAIAQEIAKQYAVKGAALYLVGRNQSRLQGLAHDWQIRYGVKVYTFECDMHDEAQCRAVFAAVTATMPVIDAAFVVHGTLPNQKACEQSDLLTAQELRVNAGSYLQWLTLLANRLEQQGYGSLVAFGSCAGDRGRQSNYVYGAAKAMIDVFMQGLRHRLFSKGVHVLTVKPGFVDTPMTKTFKKGLLWAQPEQVATRVLRAIDRRQSVVYTPWFWGWIMGIIRAVPECLFHRSHL